MGAGKKREGGAIGKKVFLVMESPSEKRLYLNRLPPLGLLGIASYLRSRGVETDVVDCNVAEADYGSIAQYDLVGFSLLCSNVTRTLAAAERIRKEHPGKKIVVGGPHSQTKVNALLKTGFFDVVIIGEAEDALYELLSSDDWKGVKGIYSLEKGETVFTGVRPFRDDLDALPFPAREPFTLARYYEPISQAKPISHIMTSRGCPFGCIFCFHSLGRKWRPRSAKNVVDEIEWLVKRHGIRELAISDDNFTLRKERAEEVFDLIIERGIKVKFQFPSAIRADRVDRALLQKAKKAGVWIIGIAPETGNEESIRRIKKGMSLGQMKTVVGWCKELGIATHGFFMVGFPWETERHVEDTIAFADALDTDFVQFTRVLPFEGTELADMIGYQGDLRGDNGMFYGSGKYEGGKLSDEQIERLIKKAYRRCYLKPGKMLRIARLLPMRNILSLVGYSLLTGSM